GFRRGKAGVENQIYMLALNRLGKRRLLVKNAKRAYFGLHRLGEMAEAASGGRKIAARFEVCKDEVLVMVVDVSQGAEKLPDVNFRSSNTARKEIESIDGNT